MKLVKIVASLAFVDAIRMQNGGCGSGCQKDSQPAKKTQKKKESSPRVPEAQTAKIEKKHEAKVQQVVAAEAPAVFEPAVAHVSEPAALAGEASTTLQAAWKALSGAKAQVSSKAAQAYNSGFAAVSSAKVHATSAVAEATAGVQMAKQRPVQASVAVAAGGYGAYVAAPYAKEGFKRGLAMAVQAKDVGYSYASLAAHKAAQTAAPLTSRLSAGASYAQEAASSGLNRGVAAVYDAKDYAASTLSSVSGAVTSMV